MAEATCGHRRLAVLAGRAGCAGQAGDTADNGYRPLCSSPFSESVDDLEAAIAAWDAERDANPKPFKWTAKADTILQKTARARIALTETLAAAGNK
jgi:hypothetical protein